MKTEQLWPRLTGKLAAFLLFFSCAWGAHGQSPTFPIIKNVAINASIGEGGTVTLSGNIVPPDQTNLTLAVNWGDSSTVQLFSLAGGSTNFSVNHIFVDDGQIGPSSQTYYVNLTLTDTNG